MSDGDNEKNLPPGAPPPPRPRSQAHAPPPTRSNTDDEGKGDSSAAIIAALAAQNPSHPSHIMAADGPPGSPDHPGAEDLSMGPNSMFGFLEREAKAHIAGVDTCQHYSVDQLREMKAHGITTVFRYFSSGEGGKCLTPQDVANFRAAGMKLAIVYEGRGDTPDNFTRDQGYRDASYAIQRLQRLGLPPDTAIYFAVDYDAGVEDVDHVMVRNRHGREVAVPVVNGKVAMTGPDGRTIEVPVVHDRSTNSDYVVGPDGQRIPVIAGRLSEYFRGVQQAIHDRGSQMQVGVYGSGFVCSTIKSNGYAQGTWMAGSTGWRGYKEFMGQQNVLQIINGGHDYDSINPGAPVGSVDLNQNTAERIGTPSRTQTAAAPKPVQPPTPLARKTRKADAGGAHPPPHAPVTTASSGNVVVDTFKRWGIDLNPIFGKWG